MRPEDPTPSGRIPENAKAPADVAERVPSNQGASAPAQRVTVAKPGTRPRKRKKPFVL
jgi:hypothetical protein